MTGQWQPCHYTWYVIAHKVQVQFSLSQAVMMTSKVNGKMEILTPCRSETPKILKQIGLNDYVIDPYNSANFR